MHSTFNMVLLMRHVPDTVDGFPACPHNQQLPVLSLWMHLFLMSEPPQIHVSFALSVQKDTISHNNDFYIKAVRQHEHQSKFCRNGRNSLLFSWTILSDEMTLIGVCMCRACPSSPTNPPLHFARHCLLPTNIQSLKWNERWLQ